MSTLKPCQFSCGDYELDTKQSKRYYHEGQLLSELLSGTTRYAESPDNSSSQAALAEKRAEAPK